MTSFNHYALGAVADFLHGVVGGLSPLEPGWKVVLVRPQPGGTVRSAETSHTSPYGLISCSWVIEGDKMKVKVGIPPNSTARVELPRRETEEVGCGEYEWNVDWEDDERFPPKPVQPPCCAPVRNEWVA